MISYVDYEEMHSNESFDWIENEDEGPNRPDCSTWRRGVFSGARQVRNENNFAPFVNTRARLTYVVLLSEF